MTDTNLLDSLFDTETVSDCRSRILESHGIDISAVYCLHTGRVAGRFEDFVLEFAIAEEQSDDLESLDDALVARTIASMRPTPMLNKPDRLTLERLASTHPVDILAFLVNRLHGNRHLATHRNLEILDPYVWRIHTHQRWTELAAAGVDLKPWIHWLLELDAKRNLHDMTPPSLSLDKLNRWIRTNNGTSLFQLLTLENHKLMLSIFEAWTFERLKEYDQRDREALAQDRWFRGNSMTQPAYVQSWITNPQFASKRAEADAKKRAKALDGKVVTPKKSNSKIQNLLNSHQALIDSLFTSAKGEVDPSESQPVKPAPKAVPMTGANFLSRLRKDSN